MFISIRIVQGANTLCGKRPLKKKLDLIYPKVSKLFNTKKLDLILILLFVCNFSVIGNMTRLNVATTSCIG